MGLNETPLAERMHIGIFGRRNAGKSSLMNALSGQKAAIVSEVPGSTTDPVYKSMELLPLGPVVFIDTPGLDDEGGLGQQRVAKAREVLRKTDLVLLVIDAAAGKSEEDRELEELVKERQIPYLLVYNKSDQKAWAEQKKESQEGIYVSARNGDGIEELKALMIQRMQQGANGAEIQKKYLVADLLKPMDFVVLVVPIDKAAPKGRLILPQQQTIRDILEVGASAIVVRDTELAETLKNLGKKPRLVITDSQVFQSVDKITPPEIELTSFSILFARYKGNLRQAAKGAAALKQLRDGDKVLICEGCTHHRQCGDIGTEKLPRWIRAYTGKDLEFVFTSGGEFPADLKEFALIVHCGGCMLNEKEMQYRLVQARQQGIPMTNYGILIADMNGILKRSLQPFAEMAGLLGNEDEKCCTRS